MYLWCLFFSLLMAAEPTPDLLKDIKIDPTLGTSVDLNLPVFDETGATKKLGDYFDGQRPVALILAYYECPMLCGIVLNAARDSFSQLDWQAGKQYRIVTVSIDPKETAKLASEKKKNLIASIDDERQRPYFDQNWHFLTAPESSSRALARSMGFGYKWVEEEKQFAHGAAVFLLSPQGKLSRVLFGASYEPRDLKLGLLEASSGKVGTIAEKILLFCYHYNPKDNKYALFATRLMRVAGAVTVGAFVCLYAMLYWRRRQKMGTV